HAVRAESPTERPSRRTTITTDAAAPRWSGGALSTTAFVGGATVRPKPAPSNANWRAKIGYDVSDVQVAPIQAYAPVAIERPSSTGGLNHVRSVDTPPQYHASCIAQ